MNFLHLFTVFVSCFIFPVYCFDYKQEYYSQKIDHFNFATHKDEVFDQRYLYNDSWWNPGKGPIFFYAGNEGDVEGFWQNSGFIMEIAPQFQALIVFGEHRYYGQSLPFGKLSFDRSHISFLTIEQALADYATLLPYIKDRFKAENCSVIAFGGSYGGMLAAYMRFKYPNVIQGAIAASAPIYQVAGLTPGQNFFKSITEVFRNVSTQCESQVRSAFSTMDQWFKMGDAGLAKLSAAFQLCNKLHSLADYRHLQLWIRNAFVYAAMMNYPYATSFMGNLPANPVKEMCKLLSPSSTPVEGLHAATALYYNSSGTLQCFDIYKEYIYCADPTGCGLGDDSKAWDYQACTEVNLEGGTDGVNDMFPPNLFNSSMRKEYCTKQWGVVPRPDWLKIMFWGADISHSSNIVFSNGNLDPWAQGGVLTNVSETMPAIIIEGGAHHLDLRASNPKDPPSVKEARLSEVDYIKKFLSNLKNTN